VLGEPVGGILRSYWKRWEEENAHAWVVGVLREGYRVRFETRPALSPCPTNPSGYGDPAKNEILADQISKLVEKGAVEHVTNPGSGYYSRVFLRPKASGGWRPILDLSVLNPAIESPKFHQETVESIRRALIRGQWTFSVDLKDAFFQVPVHPRSRKYLRFVYNGQVYQYKVLPFGMTSSPYVFTRVVNQLKQKLQGSGHQLFQFLDDWLGQCSSYDLALERSKQTVALCHKLGLVVNTEKSELVPKQVFDFVGMHCNLIDYTVSVTDRKQQDINLVVSTFLSKDEWPARKWLSLLGTLQSQCRYMAEGLLHLRPIQWHLKMRWQQRSGELKDLVSLSPELRDTLAWWLVKENVQMGVPIKPRDHDLQVFTDASTQGWGGYAVPGSTKQRFSGTWSGIEAKMHINVLEMRAVTLVLKLLKPLRGSTILVVSDNVTVVAYINHRGGTRSHSTWLETQELLFLARDKGWTIRARHIAGNLNVLADRLSRKGQVLPTEWSLRQDIADLLFNKWGKPQVDLFATWENKKCPLFVSPYPDPRALDCDALNISWEGMVVYAFPPRAILSQVLAKARETRNLRMILVAPDWARQTWYPTLRSLVVTAPFRLPTGRTMLMQPASDLFHEDPEAMGLHGWLLETGT
jgi:ribonuclease HI